MMRKSGRKFGIKAKLLLAYGFTSALAISAAVLGWFGMEIISSRQNEIINKAIPAMIDAQKLAGVTAQIVAATPMLANAKTLSERSRITNLLESNKKTLNQVLDKFNRDDLQPKMVINLLELIDQMIQNISQQSGLVKQRIKESRLRDVVTTELLIGAASIKQVSGILTYTGIGEIKAPSVNRMDKPTSSENDNQIKKSGHLAELRLRSVEIGALLNLLSRETDLIVINYVQREFYLVLEALNQLVNEIYPSEKKDNLERLLVIFNRNDDLSNKENVFELHRNIRRIDIELNQLQDEGRTVAANLNEAIGSLMDDSSSEINDSMQLVKSTVDFGRMIFIIIGVISILIVALILWFSLQQLINRLLELSRSMRELASGNYSVEIDSYGNDELAIMANTVMIFKKNAIAKAELEKVQQRTEKELRQHKSDLEKLVHERTIQLQKANRELVKEAERHIEARVVAEEANNAKTDFLATMSHELRTPMSGLLGTITLLKDTGLSPQQDKYVNVLNNVGKTLLELLDEILGYSQIEAGKIEFKQVNFDLYQIVDDMTLLMRSAVTRNNVNLKTEIDPSIPHIINGDPGKLRQILLNLIGNAIKFTDEGNISLCITLQGKESDGEFNLLFELEDTGIGIPEDMQEEVFEPFTQVDSLIDRQHSGIGLGLTICRRLIVSMGGEIHCDSKLGGGTKFSFTLRFCRGNKRLSLDTKGAISQKRVSPLHVLLVEDDETNRMILRAYLEKSGHQVEEAFDGRQAVDLVKKHDFDVILMDIRLPRLNGIQASGEIRKLKNTRASTPIIAISAHLFQQDINQYIDAGMDGFLEKPVSPAELYETLFNVVNKVPVTVKRIDNNSSDENEFSSCHRALYEDIKFVGLEKTRRKVELFLTSSPKMIANISEHATTGSANEVEEQLHKLKGSAAVVGLKTLYSQVETLEVGVKNNTVELTDLLEQLETTYQNSCRLLKKTFERLAAEHSVPLNNVVATDNSH